MPPSTAGRSRWSAPRPIRALSGVLVRRVALGAASGVLAGLACWALLTVLSWATKVRVDHGWLVALLPAVGFAVGAVYHRLGGRSQEGSALLLEQIHEPTAWVPRRMAPLVGIGTVASHLVGASVGREGTALQMSGSLTDGLARALRLGHHERRWLLVAGLGGGFGAVFGVPWAGAVFALEVQSVRRGGRLAIGRLLRAGRPGPPRGGSLGRRPTARAAAVVGLVVPVVVASFVGNMVVRLLGYHHTGRPRLHPRLDALLLGRVAMIAAAFGLAAVAFVEGTDVVRHVGARLRWSPARPLVGGMVVLALVALVGRNQLGLSLPLIDSALAGEPTPLTVPILKIVFTAVCLGTGYVGGEVTPLFVIGTTLGSALSPVLGLDPVVGGAVGFVAVFGGATNTPLACTVMGMELFGPGLALPLGVGCWIAYWCSGGRGIYATQRLATPDGHERVRDRPALIHRLHRPRPPT